MRRAAMTSVTGVARRIHVPRRVRVWGPVLGAIAADFVLQTILSPRVPIAVRSVSFIFAVLLAVALGRFLGARAWQRRGRQLANYLLRRAMRGKHRPLVFLTDRPDFKLSMTKRLFLDPSTGEVSSH